MTAAELKLTNARRDDDDDEEEDEEEEDYPLVGCSQTHTCVTYGYEGWCVLTEGHAGPCSCGKCGSSF
jgi:hypothetical protein